MKPRDIQPNKRDIDFIKLIKPSKGFTQPDPQLKPFKPGNALFTQPSKISEQYLWCIGHLIPIEKPFSLNSPSRMLCGFATIG
jgi:hypothetical protein